MKKTTINKPSNCWTHRKTMMVAMRTVKWSAGNAAAECFLDLLSKRPTFDLKMISKETMTRKPRPEF